MCDENAITCFIILYLGLMNLILSYVIKLDVKLPCDYTWGKKKKNLNMSFIGKHKYKN